MYNIVMKNKDYVIHTKEDYDAICETIYLLTQPEVMNSIRENEKEDLSKMKIYNPKEPW